MQYRQKLDQIEQRFEELTAQMADPAVINDSAQYRKIAKAHNDLAEIVARYRDWKNASRNLEEARAMLNESDAGLREMAQEEVASLEPQVTRFEEELKFLLLPKDPHDICRTNITAADPSNVDSRDSTGQISERNRSEEIAAD